MSRDLYDVPASCLPCALVECECKETCGCDCHYELPLQEAAIQLADLVLDAWREGLRVIPEIEDATGVYLVAKTKKEKSQR